MKFSDQKGVIKVDRTRTFGYVFPGGHVETETRVHSFGDRGETIVGLAIGYH